MEVVSARHLDDYRVSVSFSDDTMQTVDFGPFLRGSRHPAVREYLNPARFAAYTIRDGDLMWGDYDLIFSLADLYAGSIS